MTQTDSNKPGKSKKDKPNQFIQFSGMAVQMGAIIGLGAWGGSLLDAKYNTEKPYWTIGLSLAGVFCALYLMIVQAKKMSNDD